MLEYLAPGLLYSLAKDGWAAIRGRKRRLTPSEVIAKRQRWKGEIERQLLERRRERLTMDVIVRDVTRMDDYPDTTGTRKGISAWYRCGLMGTYYRGILLGLSWERLTLDQEKYWRYTNHQAGEEGDAKVILIGYVRYENIEAIEWDGDQFYGQPHVYCYFDARRGEPYEKLAFCEKQELDGVPFYTELSLYEPVHRRSRKLRIR